MPATERAIELLTAAAEAAHDKKAENVLAFDVSEQLAITDAFLVASASNDRQVRAIVDAIEEKLRVDFDAKPVRREGAREGRWVLLDYLEIVVHVQHDEERNFYSLERLWRDCPIIPLPGADGTIAVPVIADRTVDEDPTPAADSDSDSAEAGAAKSSAVESSSAAE
jgi:ribosome-associated protein